jgi:hypothetical protein
MNNKIVKENSKWKWKLLKKIEIENTTRQNAQKKNLQFDS